MKLILFTVSMTTLVWAVQIEEPNAAPLLQRLAAAEDRHLEAPRRRLQTSGYELQAVGEGRCTTGVDYQIKSSSECRAAISSLGHTVASEIAFTWADKQYKKVCGCSYNVGTGRMQFNQFTHPGYCYPSALSGSGMHRASQDFNSFNNGLGSVCKIPDTPVTYDYHLALHPTPIQGDYYLGVRGVGRCPAGHGYQLLTKDTCRAAIESLGHTIASETAFTLAENRWDKVCGCSYNPATRKMQFNEFAYNAYCYQTDTVGSAGHRGSQNGNSWASELLSVCRTTDQFNPPDCTLATVTGGSWDQGSSVVSGATATFASNNGFTCTGTTAVCTNGVLNTTPSCKGVELQAGTAGRCTSGNSNQIRTLAECAPAIEALGHTVAGTLGTNQIQIIYTWADGQWGRACGCSYNPATKQMQFNEFTHEHFCYDTQSTSGINSNQHRTAQNNDATTNGLQSVCYTS